MELLSYLAKGLVVYVHYISSCLHVHTISIGFTLWIMCALRMEVIYGVQFVVSIEGTCSHLSCH